MAMPTRTFTYTFGTPSGNISITTNYDPQSVTTSDGNSYSGYAITGISGTFNGEQISGFQGSGGQEGTDTTYTNESYDNTIFVNANQGANGSSFDGIDGDGIQFETVQGNTYNIYQTSTNQYSVDENGSNISTNASPASTNYASMVCFCTGTLIRVARGGAEVEVAVEKLQIGDLVVTASGAHSAICWIGHRTLDCRTHPRPHDVHPVRVRASAFGLNAEGEAIPARALRLSPGHTVLVGADANNEGGVLVPIMCLINGTSIAREPVDSVTYWHVELEGAHDVLLAEGLAAESYLDWGDRPFFDEASDHALHNPDFVVPGLDARCRPVAIDGPLVDAERRRLDAVFAVELAAQSLWDKADDFAWLAA